MSEQTSKSHSAAEPDDASTAVWSGLSTEARHPDTMDLDRQATVDVVAMLLEEDRRGIGAALAEREAIGAVADRFAETLDAGGRVLFAGAGTSGRLGVLEAAECPPTFGTSPEMIGAVMAGGREAVFAAREGAEDIEGDGRAAAANLGPRDLLIAVSASSVTPYAKGAIREARSKGAWSVLVTCTDGTGLEGVADTIVALDTGPELLTGSTRLKAGSATKAVLNAITTAAMVRSGKVFENLMVDLRPGSAKLVDRSVRIVAAAAELSSEAARELLERTGGEVKTAIIVGRLRIAPEAARRRLAGAGGHVRRALEAPASDGRD